MCIQSPLLSIIDEGYAVYATIGLAVWGSGIRQTVRPLDLDMAADGNTHRCRGIGRYGAGKGSGKKPGCARGDGSAAWRPR